MNGAEEDPIERGLALARHYIDVGRAREALASLSQHGHALAARPEAWALRGRALLNLNRYDEAAKALELGLGLDAEDLDLLYLLGFAELRRHRLEAAERRLLDALRMAPESPVLLSTYAEVVGRAGQFRKARALLERVEQADPESEDLNRVRALLATLEGRDREAAKRARDWVADSPEEPAAHLTAAVTLGTVGKAGAGYRHAREAATLDARVVERDAEFFHEQRLRNHWSMLPLWPFQRLGPALSWAIAVGTMYGLRALGMTWLALAFALVYLALAIYSWTAPPLVRYLLRRRSR
jgi:Flp pilus assembly protein TadD